MDVLLGLVMSDLNAHPEDPATRKEAIEFLFAAVGHDWTLSTRVVETARAMNNAELFDAAVAAGFRNGVPAQELIRVLVDDAKKAPPGTINWDKRCVHAEREWLIASPIDGSKLILLSFRVFVAKHLTFRHLSMSLDAIESALGPGDMRTSFQQWRSTTELSVFESRQMFGPADHDAIMGFTISRCDNIDWIRNT